MAKLYDLHYKNFFIGNIYRYIPIRNFMLKISTFAPPNVDFCVLVKQKSIFVNSISFDSCKNLLKLLSHLLVLWQLLQHAPWATRRKPVLYCPVHLSISYLYLSLLLTIIQSCVIIMHDISLRKTSDARCRFVY